MRYIDLFKRLAKALSQPARLWPLSLVGVALLAVSFWVVYYTYKSSEALVLQYATDSAQKHAESITQFRNYYVQDLLPRAQRSGDQPLPLPTALAIDLGHYLSQVEGGTQVRLYSDLPFPGRASERQLDEFQQQALAHLARHPEQPFVREEMLNGQRVLRYVQADRMRSGCVACHNHFEGSPKTDWEVGDVRGALEVVLPVAQWQSATTALLNRTFMVLLVLLLGGLWLVWLSFRQLKSALLNARELSTQREDAIQELRLSESKLNSIFASVPEAIVVADARGRIVQCNVATTDIFGFTQAELIGQNVNVFMQGNQRAAHDGYMTTYHATGNKSLINQPRVVEGMRKDGSLFPVRVTINETRMGDAHFFIGVMQDFTTIQHAQDLLVDAKNKAEQANRMRGEFLANMSHEIRTPMNGILGMTELAMSTEDRNTQKEYLSLARDSASYLLHIINQILDFSKIEAGTLELDQLAVNPAQLVSQTVRSLEQLAQPKGIALQVINDPALPESVWMDPVRVRQVLINLIGNAIKFTEDGVIVVKTSARPALRDEQVALEISVDDTGIGFDASRLDTLFSPFTQADGSITRSYGGTGLGLAITRSLMQLMGGDVTASSQVGQGACFTIRFIVKRASSTSLEPGAVHAADDEEVKPVARSLSVLLVEDHAINRKLAQIMLERMGHRFVLAEDGQQALNCLEKERFDVVLMDVMMPGMDGLTALQIWREREVVRHLLHTPILMVTAHAMTGDRERFLAAGADGYVSKPISEESLGKEIDRVCRRFV